MQDADLSGTAMKITGAAAARKFSFDKTVSLGRAVNAQVVSIGSALDHCHVPGRQGNEPIPKDVAIVGAGIHNEPVSLLKSNLWPRAGPCSEIADSINRAHRDCHLSLQWKT